MVGEVIAEALRRRMPFSIEYRILDAASEMRWVFQKGQGIFDDAGNLLHLAGAICDMTEQKKMGQDREVGACSRGKTGLHVLQ